jgi:hypothetical protein
VLAVIDGAADDSSCCGPPARRTEEGRSAATFETASGQVYGVRIGPAGATIRALEAGEY